MSRIHNRQKIPFVDPWGPNNEIDYHQDLWAVPWKQFGFEYCCVYLITPSSRQPVKIGISENAASRLNTLQTAHWEPLQVSRYWLCADKNAARQVELKSHLTLRDSARGLLGEWFDVKLEKAAEIVEFAAKALGVELATKIPDTDKFAEVRKHMQAFYDTRYKVQDREWEDYLKRTGSSHLTDLAKEGHIGNRMGRSVSKTTHHHPVCLYHLEKEPLHCTCGRTRERQPGFNNLARNYEALSEARRKRA